jgi:hypothetical protein
MKNITLSILAASVLFGAGCTKNFSVDATKNEIVLDDQAALDAIADGELYKNEKMHYQFNHPKGWVVEDFKAPDSDVLSWQMVKPKSSKSTNPSTSIIFFSKKDGMTYKEESVRDSATMGDIGGKFFILNYSGTEESSGFRTVLNTFAELQ